MIKDVDRSDVIGTHLIESPVLGPISTKDISGGVKTLILMDFSSVSFFEALMLNTDAVVHSYEEYLEEALKIKER